MVRLLGINIAFSFLLVALFGMSVFVSGCSEMALHAFLPMGACPQATVAFVHHLDVFLAAFTALVVAITLLFAFHANPFGSAIITIRLPLAASRHYAHANRDSVAFHLPHQLFSRGILHRKDAPALRL